MFSIRAWPLLGNLEGPGAEETGPIPASNGTEKQGRYHLQEIPWGISAMEDLGRRKTRSPKLLSAGVSPGAVHAAPQ